ncbi:MAG: hypothetical protein NT157_04920 [Candidatus Micrarchaeota archaeon]|nr:hypothetical protein [Candidatus Micrarchaeota archaeon]
MKKQVDRTFAMLEKLSLIGLGVVSMTKNRADAIAEELVKTGEVSAVEGRRLAQKLLKKSARQRGEAEVEIRKAVKIAMRTMPLATKEDLKKLEMRIAKLEKRKRK